ncbi:MAG: hypothetical protein KJ604_19975 [Gammaproteobacteria bacterium]|nr:hypothetical protein [Gammaproteobacteria bacterium]
MIKKMLLIIAFVAIATMASGFCDGWRAGYKAGYCYKKYTCLAPLVPLCPLPGLGEDTWLGGYNRGFLAGLAAQK